MFITIFMKCVVECQSKRTDWINKVVEEVALRI
jgi:hypothetical protein